MNSVLPSLSDEGFISNKEVIIAKLFKYFLASNYSQSNTFYGDISSLSYIIATNIPNDKMRTDLETTLIKLYGRYFDSVDFNVNIETDNTDVAKIYIDGTLQDGVDVYNLSKTVAIQGSTITNFENLLDEYYTEINM
jgi:hypothetical protein